MKYIKSDLFILWCITGFYVFNETNDLISLNF